MPAPVPDGDTPPHRYNAALAAETEARWQARWDADAIYETPNPSGQLASGRGLSMQRNSSEGRQPLVFVDAAAARRCATTSRRVWQSW